VGVFANTARYAIQELTTFCRLDWLLFLGSETAKECEDYFQPIIKYLSDRNLHKLYKEVNNFLFDLDNVQPFGLNGWNTSQAIYHNVGSAGNGADPFALYFDLSNTEFKI
ncbi:MAG: hypothetical protein WDA53_09095, partial [Bacillota bacterium]